MDVALEASCFIFSESSVCKLCAGELDVVTCAISSHVQEFTNPKRTSRLSVICNRVFDSSPPGVFMPTEECGSILPQRGLRIFLYNFNQT